MLLGWARERRLLSHDLRDVDFAYEGGDEERFRAAVPSLVAAGWKQLFRYRANDGRVTEHSFYRRGAKFDFFQMERRGQRLSYFVYGVDPADPSRHLQARLELADQELVGFDFLGRHWLKHADHDAELTAIYGNWRAADPGWKLFDDRNIVERVPWVVADNAWR